FSGFPYAYPVVGGFLDKIGGLELARSFSLVCMLGVTTVVWSVTRTLFDRPAAVFASAIYAVTGVVLFVGRLATFDAMCLFLIALATGIGVHCGTTKRPWTAVVIGPILVLAVLSKYVALLFVPPVLLILACVSLNSFGWRAAASRLFLAVSALGLSLGIAYELIDKAAFHAIVNSTTNRVPTPTAPRLDLFTHVLTMGGIVFGIGLAGLAFLLRQKRLPIYAVLTFGASLLAPAYHVYKQEPISLDKHIAYALFFAVPLAGVALAWLAGYGRQAVASAQHGYWLAGAAVILAAFTLGLHQSKTLYANWANTSQLSYALHTQLRDGAGRIFAEDIEVARYNARDVTQEWQWNGFYYPSYVTAEKRRLYGPAALDQAVKDRYYDFVELSFDYFPNDAYALASNMAATKNYDLIAIIPFKNSFGKGHFYLWRSAQAPGLGHFTSLAQLRTNVWSS
ncbi:MAG TPA: glycosyltransferase family 39 protein, partial [Acidimicrobiia bacterium]|nr:glycosyltransferase family 39 protein [Acidimicrobiia bacterium]